MASKALFLDRDGVINVDTGYVHRIEDFLFIDEIFDVTRMAISKNYLIIVVTNQAGIGRGYYTEDDFKSLTNWMLQQFKIRGLHLDKVFFSPYHPIHGLGRYKKDHISRKPRPGMLLEAQREFDIDFNKSVLVGDKASDVEAGISAGVGTNLLISLGACEPGLEKYLQISSVAQVKDYL